MLTAMLRTLVCARCGALLRNDNEVIALLDAYGCCRCSLRKRLQVELLQASMHHNTLSLISKTASSIGTKLGSKSTVSLVAAGTPEDSLLGLR